MKLETWPASQKREVINQSGSSKCCVVVILVREQYKLIHLFPTEIKIWELNGTKRLQISAAY